MVVYELKGTSLTLDKGNEMGSRHGILFAEDRHIYLNKEMIGMYVLDEAKKKINVTLLVKDPKVIEVLYKMDPKIKL
jgi:hypothetical protein